MLTKLIEEEKVNYVLRKNKNDETFRININYGTMKFLTKFEFGDIVYRNNEYLTTIQKENDKFKVKNGDRIYREGELLPNVDHVSKKVFDLEIGDIVERHPPNVENQCYS